MFKKVLIANRGAIACRIIRTLRHLGIGSVAVYSEADAHSLHVRQADEAVCIGPAPAAESYLNGRRILQVAQEIGAEAIHPGYGFLSENAEFAVASEAQGIAFVGPTGQQMRDFGLKHTARRLAQRNGVPLLPGSGLLDDLDHARQEALHIGYPVMLKSTSGGGGIGMQLCWNQQQLDEAFHSVQRLARSNFSQGGIYLEKYVERARHIEVQIFGDGQGKVVVLGERDCSVQRRNQKVIEESPAPRIDSGLRECLQQSALRLGESVSYRSAGTVEYVYDVNSGAFYFLEVNTRLQVEHGVTEMVTGVDLVEWMLRVAAGESNFLDDYRHAPKGHAIQVRLYAEDPGKQFQPAAGLLTRVVFPQDIRVDSWVEDGTEVLVYYDPMIAKLIAHGDDREVARDKLAKALATTELYGIESNLAYLRQVLDDAVFTEARHDTRYLDGFTFQALTIDVLSPGTHTTVQDFPGRIGYWDIGVPPSGPMDDLAFCLGNRILGNPSDAAGLELTVTGPTLRCNCDTVIALTGAAMQASLDDRPIAFWQPIAVKRGGLLRLRQIQGSGNRSYISFKGGLDVPDYMGSKATFTLGRFGGHAGRTLLVGDVLHLHETATEDLNCTTLPAELVPSYGNHWNIRVMYGPHGAPDFFTEADIHTFFNTAWEVHYNSSRTGIRLVGPKPQWARSDGGEAGLHPSNIHDNAYAIGSIDFTGDMPVILGPDGPSLGGFVCPATIIQADLWQLGQVKPGDRVCFRRVDIETANRLEWERQHLIDTLRKIEESVASVAVKDHGPILHRIEGDADTTAVCYRQAGDRNILLEYGPLVLDLNLRFRVHALMEWVRGQDIEGILDLTPGIRSLQIHYDSRVITQRDLLAQLIMAEAQLPAIDDMEVPSRIVHLPLSWDDPATRLAIEKYLQSVRADAPWCPSNIEFIRRINGLERTDQVQEILFQASYLVLGLGDVYLGAPVATPLDPRHRLVTTKYNPARTWTPENAVGIGGAYLCIYGMEGPGGYQFVGRTLQMWNRYRQTADFRDGNQWLLRFFDQIRFYPASHEEILRLREDFIQGKFRLQIEQTVLKLRDYNRFLHEHEQSIQRFKQGQQAAFEAERARWEAQGQIEFAIELPDEASASDAPFDVPAGCLAVASPVTGSVWSIAVKPGQHIQRSDNLLVVEAMKMEIAIDADEPGVIKDNIDLAGVPTTAACPAYAYTPGEHAFVVQRLLEAGAIPIGKTNLDQFATGLVGTRSPYGACQNPFNADFISGGSSSGSAVAVASGLVSFALGTDTAGSGRVPAAFSNIVGLKPTRGLVSTCGVVPACRSLDCVSIFALCCDDSQRVLDVCAFLDSRDAYARQVPAAPPCFDPGAFRFGVPSTEQLVFFGNHDGARLFNQAVERLQALGGHKVEVDFAPFLTAARLLYEGPWIAERYAAIEKFIEAQPDSLLGVTRTIISVGPKTTAVDTFKAQYRLMQLRRQAASVWQQVDCLLTPTAGTVYRIEQVEADPVRLNNNLGYYTNFMNLLDLSAVAVPAGLQADHMPFGVTLFAPAFADRILMVVADRLHQITAESAGATGLPLPPPMPRQPIAGTVPLAVCGAHLSGLALNHQLTERGAWLLQRTRTAAAYRLYALPGGPPQRPGLVRKPNGQSIEVEVWAMPTDQVGGFLQQIPPPLGLGQVQLEDASWVCGFICEPYGIKGADDVTSCGGWRNYLAHRKSSRVER